MAAQGEIVLLTDFDQATPMREFDKFWNAFRLKGADIVIDSRVGEGAVRIGDPAFRYWRSRILNLLVKALLFRGVDDTQCGFKAMRMEVAKKIFKKLKVTKLANPKGGFMGPWDIEVLFLARKLGCKIVSIPVTWHYVPSRRLAVFKEPLRFVWDILLIRLFSVLGKYD